MKIIDLNTWKRAEHYKFFHRMDYPQYNICMNIEITNFLQKVKERKLPFYYAMIYAAMTAANEVEELRYRIRGEQVILHDKIHPSFTEITPGDELFKMVTVNLEETIDDFSASAGRKSEQQTELFRMDEERRDDLVYITCIPWISFTHISHTFSLNKEDAVPRISWGKYYREGDKVLLPFSVQVNHAFCDGLHVGRYVEKLQEYLDTFE
jgi:chloramphenicol O-acetyltransferase type A